MKSLAPGQTLQPTALVHEAYLRIVGENDPGWESRAHFFFAAARAMKDILVEQARYKSSLKRGGAQVTFQPEKLEIPIETPADDMLALEDVLVELEQSRPRLHQLVLLRFFVGLTIPQTAAAMGVSERTLEREWRLARVRIFEKLEGRFRDPDGLGDTP